MDGDSGYCSGGGGICIHNNIDGWRSEQRVRAAGESADRAGEQADLIASLV